MGWILYILSFIVIIYYLLQWNSRINKFKNQKISSYKTNSLISNNTILNKELLNTNLDDNKEGFFNTTNSLNPYCQEYITPVDKLSKGYYNEDDTNSFASANPNKDTYLSTDDSENIKSMEVKRALHVYPINRMDLNKKSIQKYEMLKKMDKTVLSKEDYETKYEWVDKIGQQLDIPADFNKESKLEDLEKAQTRTLIDSITDYDEQKWNCQRIYQECGTRLHPKFALKPYSYQEYDKFLDYLLNDY
tara:strand:+ start:158 stop:898 length:741 start_codon:yes stop_codon:yes gene_type:complete